MSRRELDLQKQIVAEIKRLGGDARICTQISPYTTMGDPDIYGVLEGIPLQIEVKDGDGFPVSDIQEKRLYDWQAAGAWAYVIKSFEEAEDVLQSVLRAGRTLGLRQERNKRHISLDGALYLRKKPTRGTPQPKRS